MNDGRNAIVFNAGNSFFFFFDCGHVEAGDKEWVDDEDFRRVQSHEKQ